MLIPWLWLCALCALVQPRRLSLLRSLLLSNLMRQCHFARSCALCSQDSGGMLKSFSETFKVSFGTYLSASVCVCVCVCVCVWRGEVKAGGGGGSSLGGLDFYPSTEVMSAKICLNVRGSPFFDNFFARNSLRMPKICHFPSIINCIFFVICRKKSLELYYSLTL